MDYGYNKGHHRPRRPEQMRDTYDRADDEKNIAHPAKPQRRDNATHQNQQLQRGGFGFLRNQNKPALKKLYDGA